ncbi:MAG: DNA translocase FtsK [Acidobacteriota bacterium]
MKLLGPTKHARLNEALAFVYLLAAFFVFLALVSYNPFDSSLNTQTDVPRATNLTGAMGAWMGDILLQCFGLAAYVVPVLILMLAWAWLRNAVIDTPRIKLFGAMLCVLSVCSFLGMASDWYPISGVIPAGGMAGMVIAGAMIASMNMAGAVIATLACLTLSIYLVSTFELARLPGWFTAPVNMWDSIRSRYVAWREARIENARVRAEAKAAKQAARDQEAEAKRLEKEAIAGRRPAPQAAADPFGSDSRPPWETGDPSIVDLHGEAPWHAAKAAAAGVSAGLSSLNAAVAPAPIRLAPLPPPPKIEDIPITELALPTPQQTVGPKVDEPVGAQSPSARQPEARHRTAFQIPPTNLLQEAAARTAWDSQELKETAAQIKSKFEEFNVRGSVTQINPGPVVTTFEFKPEAGVKYSRITTLTEDLCLGLQAESILIERIPGKPTVGIEVPNTKREVISLRQILESDEFTQSASPLTVALGKDINGRIKVAALDTMPHLLVAGSTGSGKSVMLNSLIMSVLYKSTPHQVRLIMVDPKRLEFGLYEGIPHLLTPVITDPKKATNALRNAVLEMERRLKLLASIGVRNIDQYNKKVRVLREKPRSLFAEDSEEEVLEEIPYILILIDELADLMMLERANVEESVARLAQMARAVGMHLVLATQRPSVDVITGLIKANFPSRISFRVATRVDSRTVLDVMGAEHLLGKGDMLFLPPGSSRLVRVHGSYVSEGETNDVVEYWKRQAAPEYDQSFLIAPPSDDDPDEAEPTGPEDPMYQEAVKVVCEMGKASTSTLQRRLRLGYGRAARMLDMMQRDGIIGPPDGSRPRDVLKAPDWLHEVEGQLR